MTSNSSAGAGKTSLRDDSRDTQLSLKPSIGIKENIDQNKNTKDIGNRFNYDNACFSLLDRWWNASYDLQHKIANFVEQPSFHIAIILLVLLDCILVIAELTLDFIKLKSPCIEKRISNTVTHIENKEHDSIEIIIELLHYSSLTLLALFLIEVSIKMYAFGRHWWNFHKKKMELLDAVIVIISFAIDLASTHKSNIFAEISLLFISLRLWRFIRIINSVAQTIRSEEEAKKKHLAINYHEMVETLLIILEKKTSLLLEFDQKTAKSDFENICKQFQTIDHFCRTTFEQCSHPQSVNAIADITHHLQTAKERLRRASLSIDLTRNDIETTEPMKVVKDYPNDCRTSADSDKTVLLNSSTLTRTRHESLHDLTGSCCIFLEDYV